MCGLAWAVRASGRPAFWGAPARRGFVQLRYEGAQSPRSAKKKDSTPFRAGSAASAWMPAVFGRGQDARLAGINRASQPLNLGFYNRLTGVIMDGLSQG